MRKEIEIIEKAFSKPLPGIEIQRLMSPSVRFTGSVKHDPNKARKSSVLLLLYKKEGVWYIPLIQRPTYKGAHSGQVSFPGGKTEDRDVSILDTALRESEEEIGVKRNGIQFISELTPLYIPNSNFMVYPQVCITSSSPVFKADKREVESIIEAPVAQLLAPQTIHHFSRRINGVQVDAPFYNIHGYVIWGATAMIVSEFLHLIKHIDLFNLQSHSYSACNAPEYQ